MWIGRLFDKLPLESQSSALSSLVTLASPGVSADSNGLFHGLGDHASNSFSLDGQPITDQQSKVFSNQIPVDAVQSMEVIEGAPPAEYGDKTSVVIDVTTRSGLGVKQPHGDITASYGTFGTTNDGFDLSYGRDKWGNFIAANGLDTGRFLDGPEFQVYHDHGNEENIFDRIDLKPSTPDSISVNLGFTRSWFQTPNSFDAQTADAWSGLVVDNGGLGPNGLPVGPADQRSKIRTFNIAPTWTHLVNPNTVFTLGAFVRQDQYNYYPSDNPFADFAPDLQSESVGQNRRLTNVGGRANVSYVKGIHNIKAGITYEDTILTEQDSFGIVDPTFLTSPADDPLLACIDLTFTSALPNCPGGTSAPYTYRGHADIRELALFFQDNITIKNWAFNLGVRFDHYEGITSANQAEPRLGIAYNIKPTNTVLRVSYARTLETPFNENLVLASNGCNDPVVNDLMATIQGYPCLTVPLRPGWRNEFHAGVQQAFGKYLVIDAEYIWKYTHLAYDFSVLGNTPITFPIEWASSKIPGYAVRASMPNFHGLSAFVVFSSVAARFFEPQVSGIGATPPGQGGNGVFRIDHDENFNSTTHIQYQPWQRGPWLGFQLAIRQRTGGRPGSLRRWKLRQRSEWDGFHRGCFRSDARSAISSRPVLRRCLCHPDALRSVLRASAPHRNTVRHLVKIPSAGTEDDDHNPPRIAPRNLFDIAVGHDNIFHGDKYKWSARISVVNLTNNYALYNFLSTFSGTHYVSPRTVTGTVGFHF